MTATRDHELSLDLRPTIGTADASGSGPTPTTPNVATPTTKGLWKPLSTLCPSAE